MFVGILQFYQRYLNRRVSKGMKQPSIQPSVHLSIRSSIFCSNSRYGLQGPQTQTPFPATSFSSPGRILRHSFAKRHTLYWLQGGTLVTLSWFYLGVSFQLAKSFTYKAFRRHHIRDLLSAKGHYHQITTSVQP